MPLKAPLWMIGMSESVFLKCLIETLMKNIEKALTDLWKGIVPFVTSYYREQKRMVCFAGPMENALHTTENHSGVASKKAALSRSSYQSHGIYRKFTGLLWHARGKEQNPRHCHGR
eukprot:TRINITY_DN13841_c0_g1_i2.p1 TRINITY_DN13841_c0_g1~~TRINITY_DN13841_c0_g1_i2.p1  ORF type:complete len:116 (-),score=16.06 TRINITY_DN13841_c0_g1_i2:92-439(-)